MESFGFGFDQHFSFKYFLKKDSYYQRDITKIFSLIILMKVLSESVIWKIFEGEMLIKTLPTTFLQLFLKIILYFKVIVKSIIDPDSNFS